MRGVSPISYISFPLPPSARLFAPIPLRPLLSTDSWMSGPIEALVITSAVPFPAFPLCRTPVSDGQCRLMNVAATSRIAGSRLPITSVSRFTLYRSEMSRPPGTATLAVGFILCSRL